MKTLESYSAMTRNARASALKGEVASFGKTQKTVAKILFAAEGAGDMEPGETLNAFAQRVTGVELRRECQGVYEAGNVLRAIASGKIAMTEEQFDKARGFALVAISGLLGKKGDPAKLARAVEIANSGAKDVVAKLKELTKKAPKAPGVKNPDATPPLEGNEIFPDLSDLAVTTYQLADRTPIFNHPEIMARFVADIQTADGLEDCEVIATILGKLQAMNTARMAELEKGLTSAKPARTRKGKTAATPELALSAA